MSALHALHEVGDELQPAISPIELAFVGRDPTFKLANKSDTELSRDLRKFNLSVETVIKDLVRDMLSNGTHRNQFLP